MVTIKGFYGLKDLLPELEDDRINFISNDKDDIRYTVAYPQLKNDKYHINDKLRDFC